MTQNPPANRGADISGDWIKVESSTPEKPEVLRLSRILGISRTEAFGAVVIFWAWLDQQSKDGCVDGIVDADVDALVSLPGFARAMEAVRWLKIDTEQERITIPHFERLNGQTAKDRSLANARQARWRAGKAAPEPTKQPAKARANGAGAKPARAIKTALSADFSASARVLAWCAENGYQSVDKHVDNFIVACQKAGYKYVDWDAALMDAIRKDWAEIRTASDRRHKVNGTGKPTEAAIKARARAVNLSANPGESMEAFTARVTRAEADRDRG